MKPNATKFDLTPEQLLDQVELTKKKLHGELLQMLENVDPAFAARLDKRPPQNVE